jgi:acyl-CoA thioester hydrolase
MTPFRYYLRVRYAECDPQKVVFNARYAEYVDVAVCEFLRALGYEEALVSGTLDFQLVKQTLEWKAAARYDQVLEITVFATHIGNTSFSIASEFRLAGKPDVLLKAETVYVFVDHHTLRKAPIPPDVRAALERGAPGVVIDHAAHLRPWNVSSAGQQ